MSAISVYGETNLVLELALQQEDNSAASDIFSMAQSGTIQLLLPAFTLSEQP